MGERCRVRGAAVIQRAVREWQRHADNETVGGRREGMIGVVGDEGGREKRRKRVESSRVVSQELPAFRQT